MPTSGEHILRAEEIAAELDEKMERHTSRGVDRLLRLAKLHLLIADRKQTKSSIPLIPNFTERSTSG